MLLYLGLKDGEAILQVRREIGKWEEGRGKREEGGGKREEGTAVAQNNVFMYDLFVRSLIG